MPASAVITAPIAYIKVVAVKKLVVGVVAVKKLVVGLLVRSIGPTLTVGTRIVSRHPWGEPV